MVAGWTGGRVAVWRRAGEVSQETGSAADSRAKVGYVPVLGQRHHQPPCSTLLPIIIMAWKAIFKTNLHRVVSRRFSSFSALIMRSLDGSPLRHGFFTTLGCSSIESFSFSFHLISFSFAFAFFPFLLHCLALPCPLHCISFHFVWLHCELTNFLIARQLFGMPFHLGAPQKRKQKDWKNTPSKKNQEKLNRTEKKAS